MKAEDKRKERRKETEDETETGRNRNEGGTWCDRDNRIHTSVLIKSPITSSIPLAYPLISLHLQDSHPHSLTFPFLTRQTHQHLGGHKTASVSTALDSRLQRDRFLVGDWRVHFLCTSSELSASLNFPFLLNTPDLYTSSFGISYTLKYNRKTDRATSSIFFLL